MLLSMRGGSELLDILLYDGGPEPPGSWRPRPPDALLAASVPGSAIEVHPAASAPLPASGAYPASNPPASVSTFQSRHTRSGSTSS